MLILNKILFFYSFLLIIILASCIEQKEVRIDTNDTLKVEPLADQTGRYVKISFIDSSYTKAVLTAKRARVYQSKMETLLDSGIQVDFYDKDNTTRLSILTANKAKIDDKTKNMIAEGNVVVLSEKDNRKLETQVLNWNNSTQKIHTNEFVKITSPKENLQGYGFESDQNLRNYKIFKVSGEQK